MGVQELNKPANTFCTHCVVGKGCTIYADRPASCQSFACSYTFGLGGPESRPDKTRVIFWEREGQDPSLPPLVTAEIDPHRGFEAMKNPALRPVIDGLMSAGAVLLLRCGNLRKLIGPNQETIQRLLDASPKFRDALNKASPE